MNHSKIRHEQKQIHKKSTHLFLMDLNHYFMHCKKTGKPNKNSTYDDSF